MILVVFSGDDDIEMKDDRLDDWIYEFGFDAMWYNLM